MTSRVSGIGSAVVAIVLLACGAARAQSPGAEPTPEHRARMAEIHRTMADCLASTRPFAECRAEMHASCQQRLGETGCPMMGGMGMGRGMGPGHGMRPGAGGMPGEPATPAPDEPAPPTPSP